MRLWLCCVSDSAGPDPDSWEAAKSSALDGDHSRRVIQRLLAQIFLSQDRPPNSQDRPPDTQLVVSLLTTLSRRTVRALLTVSQQVSQCVRVLWMEDVSPLSCSCLL